MIFVFVLKLIASLRPVLSPLSTSCTYIHQLLIFYQFQQIVLAKMSTHLDMSGNVSTAVKSSSRKIPVDQYSDDQSSMTSASGTISKHSVRSYITSYSEYDNSSLPSKTEKSSYVNPVVALKEQNAVVYARLVVVAVLIIALAVVTGVMYWVISANERKEFEAQVRTKKRNRINASNKSKNPVPLTFFLLKIFLFVIQV